MWNWALSRCRAYFTEHGKSISSAQLSRELTLLKRQPETIWLKEINAQLLQQALHDLDHAFRAFFEKHARYPRFKSRKRDTPRFRVPQQAKVANGKVFVSRKIGWVRIRQSRAIDGETKSATFKRDACGRWYVTLVVHFDTPDAALPHLDPDKVIGIDAGLIDFVVSSEESGSVPAPRFFRNGQRKLRRAQRALCRRKNGSNRRNKARLRVAKIYQKISDQRHDFLHKLSTDIIKRHDGVCVENLNYNALAKTKLGKSFMDAAHGEFRRQLAYKAIWYRKHFAVIDRFYPSSKRCHVCGAINDALTLSDRKWVCVCGVAHDRDRNAALNIRDEGLNLFAVGHTEKQNAQGARVRPGTSGQLATN